MKEAIIAVEFEKDDYLKIDPEPHLIGDMSPVNHFPGVQMWWRAIDNITRPLIMRPLECRPHWNRTQT